MQSSLTMRVAVCLPSIDAHINANDPRLAAVCPCGDDDTVGNDARKAIADGYPIANVLGSDIEAG